MRVLTGLMLGTMLLAGQASRQQGITKAHGDRFQTKLARIVKIGNTPPSGKARAPESTVGHRPRSQFVSALPRTGTDPSRPGRSHARGARRRPRRRAGDRRSRHGPQAEAAGWLDPMGYLTGRLPMTARGKLTTQNGVGRFELESAEISGRDDPEDLRPGASQLLLAVG